jgi:hypothetical protein
MNDMKHGEGFVLFRNGRMDQGDYRGGYMDGKTSLKQYVPADETRRIFAMVLNHRDAFIDVGAGKGQRM